MMSFVTFHWVTLRVCTGVFAHEHVCSCACVYVCVCVCVCLYVKDTDREKKALSHHHR